eukprot:552942-Amphidinium_carterae.1
MSSSSPVLNFLGAEVALELELRKVGSLVVAHVPGSCNVTADALSRQFCPSPVDTSSLCVGKARACAARDDKFYYLPTP